MQHHTHTVHSSQQRSSRTHLYAMRSVASSGAHAPHIGPPLSLAPPPLHQQQQQKNLHQSQSQPQRTTPTTNPTTGALQQGLPMQQPQQHQIRDHPNRLLHHSPHYMLPTSNLQKIRQQPQHLAANNENNNSRNSNNNKIIQQQQYLQQQQQQSTSTHMKNHQQIQQHHLTSGNGIKHQQLHHQQYSGNAFPPSQNYYAHNNNSNTNNNNTNRFNKYNNSNRATNDLNTNAVNTVQPKIILQNPNRVAKPKLSTTNKSAAPIGKSDLPEIVDAQPGIKLGYGIKLGSNIKIAKVVIGKVTPVVSAKTADVVSEIIEQEAETNGSAQCVAAANTNADAVGEITNNDDAILSEDLTLPKNSKEKTPMCLVNELARFNKITHQYRLLNEKGPAHCKRFTVMLKLGDEEYTAEGFKIKKAQHLAAAEAMQKTKYKQPVPKISRRVEDGASSRIHITPTVELNALAMKLGLPTSYLYDPRQVGGPDTAFKQTPDGLSGIFNGLPPPLQEHSPSHIPTVPFRPPIPNYMRRNNFIMPPLPHHDPRNSRFQQRGVFSFKHPRFPLPLPHAAPNGMLGPPHHVGQHFTPLPTTYKITLVVGKEKYVGTGRTMQQAKHDAAAKALQILKTQATQQLNEQLSNTLEDSDGKSPVSMVHEIALKRGITVHFKVLREEGPAHMKNFITACVAGTLMTEGEGNGKKISKKRAAEKMVEELKKLPPLTPTKSPVKRIKMRTPNKAASAVSVEPTAKVEKRSKRSSGSIKEKNESISEENPVTRLTQLLQSRKEKEPVYELIGKNGNENARRREFIIEVTASGTVARGTGNSKKAAKRNAAQNLLDLLNIEEDSAEERSTPSTDDCDGKTPVQTTTLDEAVDYVDSDRPSTSTNLMHAPTKMAPAPATIETTVTMPVTSTATANIPHVTTSAGQIPGILITRQNKKNALKKKELTVAPIVEKIAEKTNIAEQPQSIPIVEPPTVLQTATNLTAVPSTATEVNNTASVSASVSKSVTACVSETPKEVVNNNNNNTTAVSTTNTTTINTASSSTKTTTSAPAGGHLKAHLEYLAKLIGFEVEFSDYPRGTHNDYLTIVTLTTEPPQICHGTGTTAEESKNEAARNALNIISELGFRNAAGKK